VFKYSYKGVFQIHFAQNLPILPAFCLLLLQTYFSNFFAGKIGAPLLIYVTGFWKITHIGTNDTVNIKAAFNIEFLPLYDCNKSLMPKITSRVYKFFSKLLLLLTVPY